MYSNSQANRLLMKMKMTMMKMTKLMKRMMKKMTTRRRIRMMWS